MTYDKCLDALADPTRRMVVEELRRGPCAVGALAGRLPVSRPAVSQHLKVLSDAGLIDVRAQGTRRVYRLNPNGLSSLRHYLDALWDDALASFAARAEEIAKETKDD